MTSVRGVIPTGAPATAGGASRADDAPRVTRDVTAMRAHMLGVSRANARLRAVRRVLLALAGASVGVAITITAWLTADGVRAAVRADGARGATGGTLFAASLLIVAAIAAWWSVRAFGGGARGVSGERDVRDARDVRDVRDVRVVRDARDARDAGDRSSPTSMHEVAERRRGALWMESRRPAARFAFAALAEPDAPTWPLVTQAALLAQAGDAPWPAPTLRDGWWQWRAPFVALVLAASSALLLNAARRGESLVATGSRAGAGAAAAPAAPRTGSRLTPWTVTVTPPPYLGGVPGAPGDVTDVTAIVGARVRVSGDFARAEPPLRAELLTVDGADAAPRALPVGQGEGRWTLDLIVPATPVAVRLRDGETTRLLTVVPQIDSLPVVRLASPVRDSVYADARGTLRVAGEARDDHALVAFDAEFIVTTGSGERYAARTVRLPTSVARRREATFSADVRLDTLGLAAGDVVHLRLVARDARPGDGTGTSETRTLRIARADERDSVAVEPAPPPETDRSLLSQRMLLMLTEKLVARAPRIGRDSVVAESRRLGAEQAALRRAVSALLFQRLGGDGESEHAHYDGDGHAHGFTFEDGRVVATPPPATTGANAGLPPAMDFADGESPVVGINEPLLEAYNAMWDAGRALEGGEPRAAIAPMQAALDAIQRARAAERVYLRGRPPAVVVDLAKVRLAGRDTGQDARRPTPVRTVDPRTRRAATLLAVAGELAARAAATRDGARDNARDDARDNAQDDARDAARNDARDAGFAVRDTLALLRLDALGDAPRFAAAVADLLTALDRGGDVTDAFVAARRALAPPRRSPGFDAWSRP